MASTTLHLALLAELADIERQQNDLTLSHSDQQLLDQAWEDVTNRLDELETIVEEEAADWRDARVVLEEEDSRPPTPVPAEPVRFAPPPPPLSVTHQTGLSRSGKLMTRLPDGRWVPAPPLPSALPLLQIPKGMGGPTMAPPPPRPGGARICNCDSDGECAYCEEERLEAEQEELERLNNLVDDREGCARCSGCYYCTGAGYDGSDEV